MRSEQDLQEAASHVGYELVQLAAMPRARRRADEAGQDHVAQACLESMLLHARNLCEFLIEGRYKSSDIHRSDFTPRWSPPNSPAKARLRNARPMLDRHLAHLSWERVETGAPNDSPERIADDVVEVMGTFVDHLGAEANPAAGWFDGQLRQARVLLQGERTGRGVVSLDTSDELMAHPGGGGLGRVIRERRLPSAPTVALRLGDQTAALARRTWALAAGALSRFVESLKELRHRDLTEVTRGGRRAPDA